MKKLKQTSLFERLKKEKLSISGYVLIHKIYNGEEVDEKHLEKLNPIYFEKTEIGPVLTDAAQKILIRIDDLFATKKNIMKWFRSTTRFFLKRNFHQVPTPEPTLKILKQISNGFFKNTITVGKLY
jgi:hypothetical protein